MWFLQEKNGEILTVKSQKTPGIPDGSHGSALLLVLAFIAILSIVVVGYLARTERFLKHANLSTSIIQTDLLAEVAAATILDDLRREMIAGADGSQPLAEGDVMMVTKPQAMVPARVLNDNIDPLRAEGDFSALIKQSIRGKPFYSGPVYTAKGDTVPAQGYARASEVSTAEPALNGRFISPDRWNKPVLLGGQGITTGCEPDWILIRRDGPLENGASPGNYMKKDSEDFVIGRYAYNIYDTGGLLDINIAGFDEEDAKQLQNASKKGSMAWADLHAIPGINNPKDIIAWRNKLTRSNYTTLAVEWGEKNGFRRPYSDGISSDNRFYTRQDLISYKETYGRDALDKEALLYLTTFSADLDQPSFAPDPQRPKVQRPGEQGGNNSYGLDDQINPAFLTIRNANNQPVVKRRFPLERLKYVVPGAQNFSAEVEKYFGLRWNNGANAWMYIHGPSISRLSDVKDREPNFFELLKAAISIGSLGGQYQTTIDTAVSPRRLGRDDSVVDYHILKIGANIIDQYDSDSYPTRIIFNGQIRACGIEDLPYLYRIRTATYRIGFVDPAEINPPQVLSELYNRVGPAARMPYRNIVLLQPSVWNPHAPSLSTEGPTEFRITAKSNTQFICRVFDPWWTTGKVQTFPSKNPLDAGTPASLSPSINYITFRTGEGEAAFREPYTLKSPNYPAGSNTQSPNGTFSTLVDPVLPYGERNDQSRPSENSNTAIGFRIGYVWSGPFVKLSTTEGSEASDYLLTMEIANASADFELQYRAPDGQYITYDTLVETAFPNHDMWIDSDNFTNPRDRRTMRYAVRIDPRTTRYNTRHGHNLQPYTNVQSGGTNGVTSRRWPEGLTFRPDAGNGKSGTSGESTNRALVNWVYPSSNTSWFWGLVSENKPGQMVHYMDPDGVQRKAMGGFSSGVQGLPMVTNNMDGRPVILNRPFRSVAELGYAFRDQPWKQIDFSNAESADAALLDVFCIHESENEDEEPVVSGRVNLNTARVPVLEAILRGVEKSQGAVLSDAEARSMAEGLVAWIRDNTPGKGPLRNRAELVGKYDRSLGGSNTQRYCGFLSGLPSEPSQLLQGADAAIHRRRQSVIRALADVATTRTWTFLIDLIVQEGRYPENARSLGQFSVSGEQRYWIHVAMDRYTGRVIAQQVEAVHE